MLRIETLAIGDELLTGKTADTNTTFVGGELFHRAMRLQTTRVIPDEPEAIVQAIREAAQRADFVICFGGLGPTSDDRTAETVAAFLGCALVQDPPSVDRLNALASKRGRVMTPQMLKQVVLPEMTRALCNRVGSAVGFACRIDRAEFFFLPGVPAEMRPMFREHALAAIQSAQGPDTELLHSRVWKCIGIPESELQRLMVPIEQALPKEAWLGYRTKFPENQLTLYWKAVGSPPSEFGKAVDAIGLVLAEFAYTDRDEELEDIVVRRLRETKQSIALAESCTGGQVVQRLTKVAGSSDCVWGGTVVYQLDAKARLLDVKLENPEDAVSKACSFDLAQALARKSGCGIVASVTGYMGPKGGTEQDPTGTFYVCVTGGQGAWERRYQYYDQSREANQWAAATAVLNLIREYLEK